MRASSSILNWRYCRDYFTSHSIAEMTAACHVAPAICFRRATFLSENAWKRFFPDGAFYCEKPPSLEECCELSMFELTSSLSGELAPSSTYMAYIRKNKKCSSSWDIIRQPASCQLMWLAHCRKKDSNQNKLIGWVTPIKIIVVSSATQTPQAPYVIKKQGTPACSALGQSTASYSIFRPSGRNLEIIEKESNHPAYLVSFGLHYSKH